MGLGTLIASPAHADSVYRCVQKGKPVSFQSEPCEPSAKTTAIRGFVPDPAPTANELAWKRYRVEQEMANRNRAMRASGAVPTGAVLPAGGQACADAKAARDAWERRVGLNRSVDGMRVWQDHVYQACR
ncbi:hypothetical protein [Lysobacter xanthus]